MLLGLVLSAAQPSPCAEVGPALSIHLDEGKGADCADAASAAPGRIARAECGPLWVRGAVGNALWFWGDPNEGVTVAHRAALDLAEKLTITAWVWPAEFGSKRFRTIVWKGDRHDAVDRINYKLHLRPSGTLEFGFKGPVDEWYTLATEEPVACGRWSHVAATYDRGAAELYVNSRRLARGRMNLYTPPGVTVKTRQHERMLPNAAALEIGRSQESDGRPGQSFCGAIDEVQVWPSVRPIRPAQAAATSPPLASVLLFDLQASAAQLDAAPYLAGRVDCPWVLDIAVLDAPGRRVRVPGKTGPDGRFRYLMNDFGGDLQPRGSRGLRARGYRRGTDAKAAASKAAFVAGQPRASVVVRPGTKLQRVAGLGVYADVPQTHPTDPDAQAAACEAALADLRDIGVAQMDFQFPLSALEPDNDDADPAHFNWDYFRQRFQSDARLQTLVQYLLYVQAQGFVPGLRAGARPRWQNARMPVGPNAATAEDAVDEVAESCAAAMKLVTEAGVKLAHYVPVWEPANDPEVVAALCAKTARLAAKLGLDVPVFGPYRTATAGRLSNTDAVVDRYEVGAAYTEAYLRIAGDVCRTIGLEDYASGHPIIESNLRRLRRQVIDPLAASGPAREICMLEFGAPCGLGPWNYYPSRTHGPCASYESAFRLARSHHYLFNAGVGRFFEWKGYDAIGDGAIASSWGILKGPVHDQERRPKYYVLRMFWKHIPRGADHVACTGDSGVLANAFARHRRFVVTLINPRPDPVEADVRVAGQRLAPQARFYTCTQQVQYQEREVPTDREKVQRLRLPPRSVSTLVCRAAFASQAYDSTV